MAVTPFAAKRNSGTVTVAVAPTDPDVATIVAVPLATEVTRPADDTVATDGPEVDHVTAALAIVAPFWSLTVAEIWDVAPTEVKLRLVAERVIEVATGVGVEVGVFGDDVVGLPSPPQFHNNSENNTAPNAIVFFMPSFCPAPLRPATQDAQNTAYWFSVSGGGVGGVPGTGVSPVRKRDPPQLPNIFRGTVFQWRRCVRSCTSTAPSPPMRGGASSRKTPRKASVSLDQVGNIVGNVQNLWVYIWCISDCYTIS